jgi:hypothetical protein
MDEGGGGVQNSHVVWGQDLLLGILLQVVDIEGPEMLLHNIVHIHGIIILFDRGRNHDIALIRILVEHQLEALVLVGIVEESCLDVSDDSIIKTKSDNSSGLFVEEVLRSFEWVVDFGEVHLGIDSTKIDLIIGDNSLIDSKSDGLAILLERGALL